MFCRRWRPEKLLLKAYVLSAILMHDHRVTGVALTGSLARLEPKIHDIDLVVFHDGQLREGSVTDPPDLAEYGYEDSFPLDFAFRTPGGNMVTALRRTSGRVPMNYIFVNEKVLWDCRYLLWLEAKEHYKDFYKRVFCDIPLILLRPQERRGMLKERLTDESVIAFGIAQSMRYGFEWQETPRPNYPGLPIAHYCSDPLCKPRESWAECRRRIKFRKMHWWHPFTALIGR